MTPNRVWMLLIAAATDASAGGEAFKSLRQAAINLGRAPFSVGSAESKDSIDPYCPTGSLISALLALRIELSRAELQFANCPGRVDCAVTSEALKSRNALWTFESCPNATL
jgi:hypothetical protein